MHGDLSALRKQSLDVNFPLIQFSEFSVGSVFLSSILGSISMFKTFMCGDLSSLKKTKDVNFQLIQFYKLSIHSVMPFTLPRFCFNF